MNKFDKIEEVHDTILGVQDVVWYVAEDIVSRELLRGHCFDSTLRAIHDSVALTRVEIAVMDALANEK